MSRSSWWDFNDPHIAAHDKSMELREIERQINSLEFQNILSHSEQKEQTILPENKRYSGGEKEISVVEGFQIFITGVLMIVAAIVAIILSLYCFVWLIRLIVRYWSWICSSYMAFAFVLFLTIAIGIIFYDFIGALWFYHDSAFRNNPPIILSYSILILLYFYVAIRNILHDNGGCINATTVIYQLPTAFMGLFSCLCLEAFMINVKHYQSFKRRVCGHKLILICIILAFVYVLACVIMGNFPLFLAHCRNFITLWK